jgi:nucleotide-binding universal stress UspA family protein
MTWNPKVIVVGLDGSDTSLHAATIATEMARTWETRLLLTTVVRPPEGWWGIGGAPPPPESLATAIVEARSRILDQAEDVLDLEGIDYELVGELGDPAIMLTEVCRSNDAGLLIVGRRGAGFVERIVVGSVADRVAHTAPCPVLTVP